MTLVPVPLPSVAFVTATAVVRAAPGTAAIARSSAGLIGSGALVRLITASAPVACHDAPIWPRSTALRTVKPNATTVSASTSAKAGSVADSDARAARAKPTKAVTPGRAAAIRSSPRSASGDSRITSTAAGTATSTGAALAWLPLAWLPLALPLPACLLPACLPPAGRPGAAPGGGPGQDPAVSITCARTPAGAAASTSGVTLARGRAGSPSGSDHRALVTVTPRAPNVACIERRTTRSSCSAISASTAALTTIAVPRAVASCRWIACGSAPAVKLASAAVSVAVTMAVTSAAPSTSRYEPILLSRKVARTRRVAPSLAMSSRPAAE
jgi:hypothetical protein